MIDEFKIREAVKSVLDPELKKSLLDLGMIRDIHVENGQVQLTWRFRRQDAPGRTP